MNLLASAIAAVAAWTLQRGLRLRALGRKRAFFSVVPGEHCLMLVSRHASSPSAHSVANRDGAALIELATIVKECGGHADLVMSDGPLVAFGRQTEFCVGGPTTNPRMEVHLRALLPGVRLEPGQTSADMTWWVGDTPFRRDPRRAAYAVLAKVLVPGTTRAVFLVAGQIALANLAAARFLAARFESLMSTYGVTGRFCLVLRVTEPETYGPDLVEVAADVTGTAFAECEPPPGPRQ